MANIVMVAGGWHGGWALTPIARKLRARGHEVFTPTLTGLGERSHLAGIAIISTRTSKTWPMSCATNVCVTSFSVDTVTRAWSSPGSPIGCRSKSQAWFMSTPSCRRMVNRGGLSQAIATRQRAFDGCKVDGFSVAAPLHLDERRAPHPLATFQQAVRLTGRWREVREKVFIYASGWPETPFTPTYQTLKTDPAWTVRSLPTTHDIIRHAPDDLVSILLGLQELQ